MISACLVGLVMFFFFQAEDGIRDRSPSRGLGDVYKRQLLGHWIEMNAVSNASNALQKLAELLPESVKRLKKDGTEETVSLKEVKEGDHLIVRAGDKMPTDGTIVKGETIVDESAVTGESRGVKKSVDDQVIGGSINGDGTIEITVTGTGENGYLAKVMDMVRKAQGEKSKLESLSDKVAKWLFYVALVAGILAFIAWLFLENLPDALERMVTVFIIACPHALGLAIPLVVARSTSIAAKNGLLLKNRNALEQANDLDVIMLDKTGTLTQGKFTVTGLEVLTDNYTKEELLKYIGALESAANHPLAIGIMNLSLIHISEPTRRTPISYAVFCLKKKKKNQNKNTITSDQKNIE